MGLKIEQRAVIKFLCTEGAKAANIETRLRLVYGDNTLSKRAVYVWVAHFKEGRITIFDEPRSGRPKTSTDEASVQIIQNLLKVDRRVTVADAASTTGLSVGSVYSIIYDILA